MGDVFVRRTCPSISRLPTATNNRILFKTKLKAYQVEIADFHFNLGSPMVSLDEKASLLHGLCHAYFFAKDHPDLGVVVVGHADTSGAPRRNYELSRQRAICIKALLTGDEQKWLQIAKSAKLSDLQRTLKSLANLYYWDCGLDAIDNQYGPKTKRAIQGFQREANCLLGLGLIRDGIMGPKSWGALFHVIRFLLKQSGVDLVQKWNFIESIKGVYECGESFPIDKVGQDNYRSKENRRVEIFFGIPEDMEPLNQPMNLDKNLSILDCVFYNSAECEIIPVAKQSSLSVQHKTLDGKPIAFAKVRLLDANGVQFGEEKHTDGNGVACWYGLPSADYKLEYIS